MIVQAIMIRQKTWLPGGGAKNFLYIYIYIDNFKNLFVRNHWTNFKVHTCQGKVREKIIFSRSVNCQGISESVGILKFVKVSWICRNFLIWLSASSFFFSKAKAVSSLLTKV